MKKRLITLGAASAAVLALTGASAFAMAQASGPGNGISTMGQGFATGSNSQNFAGMQAMHNSPEMQQAMAKFSPQLRSQCNSMHAQMSSHMNGASGSGMMGGQMMGGQ